MQRVRGPEASMGRLTLEEIFVTVELNMFLSMNAPNTYKYCSHTAFYQRYEPITLAHWGKEPVILAEVCTWAVYLSIPNDPIRND